MARWYVDTKGRLIDVSKPGGADPYLTRIGEQFGWDHKVTQTMIKALGLTPFQQPSQSVAAEPVPTPTQAKPQEVNLTADQQALNAYSQNRGGYLQQLYQSYLGSLYGGQYGQTQSQYPAYTQAYSSPYQTANPYAGYQYYGGNYYGGFNPYNAYAYRAQSNVPTSS